jgi:hypothetical protein
MNSTKRTITLDASPDVALTVVVAVVVLAVALALVLTVMPFRNAGSVSSFTTTPPAPVAMQSAEQVCQNEANHANTAGVIEPLGIAQIQDHVYGTCMDNHGFPLTAQSS